MISPWDKVVELADRAVGAGGKRRRRRSPDELPYALFDFELWAAWQRARSRVSRGDRSSGRPAPRTRANVLPFVSPPGDTTC